VHITVHRNVTMHDNIAITWRRYGFTESCCFSCERKADLAHALYTARTFECAGRFAIVMDVENGMRWTGMAMKRTFEKPTDSPDPPTY
jgi:hypothetical protein